MWSKKIKSKTQSLLTSSFLLQPVSKDYGTVIPGHENPYKQEKNPTITHQHRLQVPRDSDSKWVGVKVYEKKPHVARIWAQNLNGIRYKKTFSSFADTLIAMNRYDVQFFSFSETNLNASNSHIRDEMDAVTQMVMPASRISPFWDISMWWKFIISTWSIIGTICFVWDRQVRKIPLDTIFWP